jgi:hypothetical protein
MGSRTAIKSNRIEEAQYNNLNGWEMMIENRENKLAKKFWFPQELSPFPKNPFRVLTLGHLF